MWPQGQTSFNWSQVMAGGGVGMPQVSTIPQTPGANPEQVSGNGPISQILHYIHLYYTYIYMYILYVYVHQRF